jgi:hypothetical protein
VTRRDDLAALQLVARMRLDLAQGRMAALRRKDDAVGETLAALDESRTTRTTALEEARGDAALQAGQDMVWHRWIDGRRR